MVLVDDVMSCKPGAIIKMCIGNICQSLAARQPVRQRSPTLQLAQMLVTLDYGDIARNLRIILVCPMG